MEFFDVIKNRHSIRAFKDKDVEEEKLQKILETVNSAPSAHNLQSYEVVLIKDSKQKEGLASASRNQLFIAEAPVVLVFCANPNRNTRDPLRGSSLYCLQDATIAAAYAQLAATALGLSSVWIGAFDDEAVSNVINASDTRPVAIIPIGYPGEEPRKTERRRIGDIVHNESF
jgi:nitroreductase